MFLILPWWLTNEIFLGKISITVGRQILHLEIKCCLFIVSWGFDLQIKQQKELCLLRKSHLQYLLLQPSLMNLYRGYINIRITLTLTMRFVLINPRPCHIKAYYHNITDQVPIMCTGSCFCNSLGKQNLKAARAIISNQENTIQSALLVLQH